MRKGASRREKGPRASGEIRLSYGPTIIAGLLIGTLLDAFYRPGWQPGLLIYSLHQLFLGPYRDFWRFHAAVLVLPLVFVNLINYALYRRSGYPSERLFFLLLSVLLNGLIFFAGVNILLYHFE